MKQRPTDDGAMPEALPEEALEALAHGREDLVDEALLAALGEREDWRGEVAEARALSIDLGLALEHGAPPEPDLDALVRHALAAHPVAPSRRSLWLAAVIGLVLTGGLTLASVGVPTAAEIWALGAGVLALLGAVDRFVEQLVPGGWGTVALALSFGLLLLVWPVRTLVRGRAGSVAAAGLLALSVVGTGSVGHAQVFEGDWPEGERVTVSVDGQPTSEVLRLAAEAAGLGLVARLEEDAPVSLHVRDMPLREVLGAVLDDGYAVERSGAMLVVRPAASSAAAPTSPATPAPPAAPEVPTPGTAPGASPAPPSPPPAPATPPADLSDRTTFGADVRVAAGEQVRSVATMGGDALIEGEVFENVVTMGGDVRVRPGGVIRGDVLTMGGDVEVAEGASVEGRMLTMGGEVESAAGAQLSHPPIRAPRPAAFDGRGLVRRALGSAAKHGLLFLLGLVLLGAMRERHANLARAIVKAPVRSGFVGLLGMLGALILTVVLLITVIGIPGAIIVAVGGFLGVYVGIAVMASVIGAALPIPALQDRPVAQLGVGILLLYLVSLVPGLSGIVAFVLAALGFGAVLLTRFGGRQLAGRSS